MSGAPLSYRMREHLKRLVDDRNSQHWNGSITEPTMSALEKRGLVKWDWSGKRDPAEGRWAPTAEGRKARKGLT